MNIFLLSICFFLLLIFELIYFKIANKYNIIDQPNHRSSHTQITIRGGGIIFCVAILLGSIYYGGQYAYFLLGLLIISTISFVDDVKTVGNKIRILLHFLAVSLLFLQLNIYNLSVYWIALAFIFVIGTINAVNFMDGINGITGMYSFITLLTLYYINRYIVSFTGEVYLILSLISLCVFNFFNFRKRAMCFAGDVGSVSIAFIILFFLLQLIIKTYDFKYILVLLVYGLDVVTTILFRSYRQENIFEAHRTHFYQFLVNEKKIPHLWVATLYGFIQLLINYILIIVLNQTLIGLIIGVMLVTVIFIVTRLYFEGANRLLAKSIKTLL